MTTKLEQLKQKIKKLEKEMTKLRRVKEELKSSEERLRIIFEYAPDACYLSDLKGTFIEGNKAAEEITGYKKEELIGKNFLKLKLLSPEQLPRAAVLLAKNALGQSTGPDEFIFDRKDGTRVTLEISTHPIKIKGKALVLGIARDITERKRTEEKLKKKIKQFERIAKLAVGRELKMVELKKKIKELEEELSKRK